MSTVLQSIYVQDQILDEDKILKILQLSYLYEQLVTKTSKIEIEIADTILMIIEQVVSNQRLVAKYQLVITAEALPALARGLASKSEEHRYANLKWISDIIY